MTTRYDGVRNATKAVLESLGCSDIDFPGHATTANGAKGKLQIQFTHNCGEQQIWQFSNVTKSLDKDATVAPCRVCGAKRRTANATIAAAKARREAKTA